MFFYKIQERLGQNKQKFYIFEKGRKQGIREVSRAKRAIRAHQRSAYRL